MNSNIEIEVVYNGIVVKLSPNPSWHRGLSIPEKTDTETLIFKNMGDFMDWLKKNIPNAKEGMQFIDKLVDRNKDKINPWLYAKEEINYNIKPYTVSNNTGSQWHTVTGNPAGNTSGSI